MLDDREIADHSGRCALIFITARLASLKPGSALRKSAVTMRSCSRIIVPSDPVISTRRGYPG